MSELSSVASNSGGSESGSSEPQSSGSTASTNEVSTSSTPTPSGSSGNPVGNVKGAEASQVVEAIENAEQTSPGMFELVIDGEKVTLTLEEMKAGYQKASASAKRFQEASKLKKEAEEKAAALEERKKQLLKNPLKAMFEEGVSEEDARRHYEEAVWQWLQQDQMTPEQKADLQTKREHEKEKAELQRQKEEIEQWKKDRLAEKELAEIERYRNEYASQLQSALQKHSLPLTPDVSNKLVGYMKEALSYGEEITFDEAAEMYKDEHQGSVKSYLKSLSPAQLMDLLGPEGVKQFRAQDVAANLKNPTPAPKKPEVDKPRSKDTKISSKDFFANLGKK